MLASLLRPKKRRLHADRSPFSSLNTQGAPFPRNQTQNNVYREFIGNNTQDIDEDDHSMDAGHDDPESAPLLPIFFASHLDALPVYEITHAIRPLIVSRCETTLSWDQLRSPQVSQFLIKPILQKIINSHFSRATLYALMTNCLQFNKEIELNPGNSGTSRSRAMVSELLAIKLLREYSTRELIDALSFEFYPLQGQPNGIQPGHDYYQGGKRTAVGAARVSCLEVAIRAQAKRFLSHPVIVQQLEAIWAGTIVFHSAADNLHRSPQVIAGYGTNHAFPGYAHNGSNQSITSPRRSVTLYDPRDASLFKLSRLRVPRYRQFLSTLSFAVLLGLFLAVLQRRRLEITTLEIIFWLWSAGFMLDEIVGFNEQGFSLYLMSFWNVFDLGILLLLILYYSMRLYAVAPYTHSQVVADQAYDVLAANAVLLFPRLFSVLDHYRYFSQLLIAFRIMASDLVAVFLLIIIACSGFFIAFTLSFGNNHSPGSIAYFCFQIVMGFTPAAWNLWDEYNVLGKTILTLFLFICHFVVVTILITVLTNSFMGIVQNANQEHQFLFAVNTISMVKSDMLFSYIAPTNVIAWLIIPLRYLMPFRQFIKVNRTIIKITHLPILFTICFYEKMILCSKVEKPTDLIDPPTRETPRARSRTPFQAFSSNGPRLVREPSVATYQKDRALDEVFRKPFGDTNSRPARDIRRPLNNSIVNNWMQEMGSGPGSPPEQDSDEVDRLERLPRRLRFSRRPFRNGLRDFTETHSVPSNPDELVGRIASPSVTSRRARDASPRRIRAVSRHTDAEGDDELTSDDNDGKVSIAGQSDVTASKKVSDKSPAFYSSRPSTAKLISRKSSPTSRPKIHTRNVSNATMLYNPISPRNKPEAEISTPIKPEESPEREMAALSTSADHWSVGKHSLGANPGHATISRSDPLSVPELGGFISNPRTRGRRQPIPFELGSDLGDNKAIASGFLGPAPSSFTTQMAYATGAMRGTGTGDQDMLSKLVLARMNNIEEGFREVIKEVKDLRRAGSRSQSRPDDQPRKRRAEKKDTKRPTSWLSKENTESHTETNGMEV
ncbi:Integral membrane channel protein [Aspergillus sclerotialis]|uniref:Integral membrane channel protein n=1 Tax=Aspergillus sclerotialis TaxID=2070753 RepID=A0A3A2ZN21_9EURO|nr:Integral membrane channel protein [Aspergillus sclerotialis]